MPFITPTVPTPLGTFDCQTCHWSDYNGFSAPVPGVGLERIEQSFLSSEDVWFPSASRVSFKVGAGDRGHKRLQDDVREEDGTKEREEEETGMRTWQTRRGKDTKCGTWHLIRGIKSTIIRHIKRDLKHTHIMVVAVNSVIDVFPDFKYCSTGNGSPTNTFLFQYLFSR